MIYFQNAAFRDKKIMNYPSFHSTKLPVFNLKKNSYKSLYF